jgi:hypothetical protein
LTKPISYNSQVQISLKIDLVISYVNKLISEAYDTKFLGIYLESTLSWRIHIEQITHKLRVAC